jgi:hypothetical protein
MLDIKRKIAKRFIALTILLALTTVFAVLGALHWFLELFTHFTPHYAAAGLLFAAALALLGTWRWGRRRRRRRVAH